jgi:radical SAM superfamily enzyme YgiQ (UPF0313 family)
LSFYTQVSIDMVRDKELLTLLRDANFSSVFIGIESPRKASLAETRKLQNERIDLVAAVHQIQSYNLFVSAGMIVGFDHDDVSIFDEQYTFAQEAQIPMVMLNVLMAMPKTPLYSRLEAEGRLVAGDHEDWSRYESTAGTANFHPRQMTREELTRRQMLLYQRLYEPSAFEARFIGNLSRFRAVQYQPERTRVSSFVMLGRIVRQYWREGSDARRFFVRMFWRGLRKSPRLIAQTVIYMGMYLHFCKVHGQTLAWDPWRRVPPATGGVSDACRTASPRSRIA